MTPAHWTGYVASMSCLFCRIVSGEAAACVVWETPETVGFLDIRPVFKGHVLIVPRRHVATLVDLPDELLVPVMGSARTVAAAMISTLSAQGSFVAMNNVVSQSVPHVHVHVVPRTKGDGLRGFFWPRTRYVDENEMAQYGQRLRAGLSSPATGPRLRLTGPALTVPCAVPASPRPRPALSAGSQGHSRPCGRSRSA